MKGDRELASTANQPLALVCAETALVFAVFFLQGAWPAPDVNETVYLAHIKHAWNPQWASKDLYLNSADAHGVLTWTLGWLSLVLSLPALAWVGRLLTWGLLACAWRRMSFALVPRPWWSVVSAAVFVCLQERAQVAGEWVIGGFESKGIAYALVFFGLERLIRGRWNQMLWLMGAAGAFHVLVGGWSAIAAGLAWLMLGRERPSLGSIKWGLLGGLMISLPGLWPALQLNANATPEQIREASRIYVFERLPHHLVPQSFQDAAVLRILLVWCFFVLLWLIAPRMPSWRRLALFVVGAAAIAAAGWLLSLITLGRPELYASLMRLYWFRLVDVMLPLGVALGSLHYIAWLERLKPAAARGWLGVAAGIGALHLAGYAVERPFPVRPRADKESKVADYAAWRHVTAWVRDHTPPDALFLTPRPPQTFRWYSGRAEVVNYKDLPQDAPTILEWWHRLEAIHGAPPESNPPRKWIKSLTERTPEELKQLGRQYGADYLVTEAAPPLALPLLYRNPVYAVYDLRGP